jgi:tetratricopeptide (TPR) repeat protein
MTEDALFMEIATELKAVHNGACEAVRKKDFPYALGLYQRGLLIADKIGYDEGAGDLLYNMANLLALMGDPVQALAHAAQAKERFGLEAGDACDTLLRALATAAKKRGIAFERSGKFAEAVEHFTAAIPYSDEKSAKAMDHEIKLLEKYLGK